MGHLTQLRLRLKSLVRRRQLEQDLDDELSFHLAMKAEKLGANNMAHKQFGNATGFREKCRDLWTFPWLESLWRDTVYGARILIRNPAFTIVAILSLALAIGANTAIFTLVNAALLEKLPVTDPDRLVIADWSQNGVRIRARATNARTSRDPKTGLQFMNVFTSGDFERFRSESKLLAETFAFTSLNRGALTIDGRTDLVKGMLVSGNYHRGLGVRPLLGRLLDDGDDKAGVEPVAVISYQIWRDRFGREPRAVGARATLNGVPITIVGVTHPEFYGVSPGGSVPSPDITVTLAMTPRLDPQLSEVGAPSDSSIYWLNVMGRLRPGAQIRAAEAELNGMFRQSLVNTGLSPGADGRLPFLRLSPGDQGVDAVRLMLREPLLTLWVVAGAVLLIACANVATLLVARAAARRNEVTVRLAMGAGRARVCRQLVTEGLLLSVAAGVLGILVSVWGSRALLGWAASSTETLRLPLAVGLRVFGFATGLSMVVGILFSFAPALRASRVNLAPALKEGAGGARGAMQRGHSGWLGQGLIVLQVALSLILIVGAGLFVRTLQNLRNVDLGIRTEGILLFGVDPTLSQYSEDRLRSFYRDLLDRLNKTPGVVSATASSMRLLTGGMSGGPLRVPGGPEKGIQAHVNNIAPSFFETMAIPVLLGRGPTERDTAYSPRVAFLSQAMAQQAFPEGSPLGRTISVIFPDRQYVVAGVVADAHYAQVRGEPPLTVYVPYEQPPWSRLGALDFAVRTSRRPEGLVPAVRSLVRELDPNLPLINVQTQQAVIDDQLRRERMFANLSTAFGGIALLLACIGIYGVVAYSAARRTAEIGIRRALGAQHGNVVGLILRNTVILVCIGVVLGTAGALALTRFLTSILYDVKPHDPATFVVGAVLLVLTALVAGYLPARRAARIDPMKALRCE